MGYPNPMYAIILSTLKLLGPYKHNLKKNLIKENQVTLILIGSGELPGWVEVLLQTNKDDLDYIEQSHKFPSLKY